MIGNESLIIARWVYLSAVMVLFGSSLFPFYALNGTATLDGALIPRPWRMGLALAALLGTAAWLVAFAAGLGEVDQLPETVRAILFESGFGPIWAVRLAGSLFLLAGSASHRPITILIPAVVLLACEGWTGHGVTVGLWGSVVYGTHVVAAGAWIGGLAALGSMLAGARRNRIPENLVEAVLWRFSRWAAVVVCVIALTGAVNTWRILGGLPGVDHGYDDVLFVKVAIFGLMLALAALNRYRLLPGMRRQRSPVLTGLARNVAFEQLLGLAVLLDVSALGTMNPGM